MPKRILAGLTVSGDLLLAPGSATVEPLRFQSNSVTPALTAGAMDYDGLVFYSTPNATSARAVDVATHISVLNGVLGYDFSSSSVAESMLSSAKTGIILPAGSTYEFQVNYAIRYQSFGDTTTQITLGWTTATVSGSPTTTLTSYLDYGNNLTGFTTASTISSISGSLATTTNFASPGSSGSRYIIWKGTGIIRVTGTGSVRIYPSIKPTTITANAPVVQTNSYFKVTPIGNGTVSGIGNFS